MERARLEAPSTGRHKSPWNALAYAEQARFKPVCWMVRPDREPLHQHWTHRVAYGVKKGELKSVLPVLGRGRIDRSSREVLVGSTRAQGVQEFGCLHGRYRCISRSDTITVRSA
jgi:tRNA A37 N6-isopentenylltransferase MiaA